MSLSRYNWFKIATCVILCSSLFSIIVTAQPKTYTVSNAHAHNDYEHPVPFLTAYNAGFGSIEVDIFFVNDRLYVAHNKKSIDTSKTLQSLYLDPLQKKIEANKGYAYTDHSKKLILLVDLKTDAVPTIDALVHALSGYKNLTDCKNFRIVITGNQPEVSKLNSYPPYILFDGHLDIRYNADQLKRVALFSDNFKNYSSWKGDSILAEPDREKIISAVAKAHSFNKPIRFWAAPDNIIAWKEMMNLKVDYINTDKIEEISAFFKKATPN